MKYLLILSLSFFHLLPVKKDKIKTRFIGKWQTELENKKVVLTFDSEAYAYLKINGETKGGKEFLIKKRKASMTYEVNSKTKPIQVDLIITMKDNNKQKRILCIAEFIDKKSMKFVFGDSGTRPKNFNSKKAVIFKRVR